MSRKNILRGSRLDDLTLRVVALVPVLALCLFVFVHFETRSARERVPEKEIRGASGALLLTDLRDWPALNWEEKERSVSSAILYFLKEKNCAILQSPGHYVVQVDRFLQEDPLLQKKNLLTALRGLAILEYDFYSGTNAEEQALGFLGPELYRINQAARKAEEARLLPADEKK